MAPLWESYSNAIAMLKLVCHFSARLYFAQDSVHVMTAYSAAFLIKVRFAIYFFYMRNSDTHVTAVDVSTYLYYIRNRAHLN